MPKNVFVSWIHEFHGNRAPPCVNVLNGKPAHEEGAVLKVGESKVLTEWRQRPWWMNFLFVFCVYMAFVYMPFDMFLKPVAQDQEVWFGILLTGWSAKATEPLHWAIYIAGGYGFWKMRRWMWPWSGVYVFQIAISMLVWNVLRGAHVTGVITFAVFVAIVAALYRSRALFHSEAS